MIHGSLKKKRGRSGTQMNRLTKTMVGLVLFFSGCSLLLTNSTREVTVIVPGTPLPVTAGISVNRECRTLRIVFTNFYHPFQHLKISIDNVGTSGCQIKNASGDFVILDPDGTVVLYDSVVEVGNSQVFTPIDGQVRAVSCNIRVQSPDPTLAES